jgi:hypothetical protein
MLLVGSRDRGAATPLADEPDPLLRGSPGDLVDAQVGLDSQALLEHA